ncbi:MAG: acyl-CoA dehydrogenase family protein [Gammaproteobacteria bacterium]|nr:acyl-CoA dehydrogenase family protein [Gammaproteobacteria bacterium]
MDFSYSDEQQLLQDSVARFVREQYSFDTRRRILEESSGFSAANWRMFAELGWLAGAIPEAGGGLGGSVIDCALLFEQFGKGLVVEPYLASVVLGGAIVVELGNNAQRAALLPALVAGELQLALGFAEPDSRYQLDAVQTRVRRAGAGWILDGNKCVVLNAANADVLLLSARDEQDRLGIYQVDPSAQGVTLQSYPTIDGARAADIGLRGVQLAADARLEAADDALEALQSVIDRATLCVCADALGAMDALLWKTVEYTKTRKQFGVPIASFQALQHRMAEMFIELEQSRSILMMALMSSDSGTDARRAVSAAKSRIGRAARLLGQEAIQLHGGIGVTDELDVGHYFKRLTAIEALFGNSDWHLRRFAALSN